MTQHVVHIRGFEDIWGQLIKTGDVETALQVVYTQAQTVARNPKLKGHFLRLPQLDRALLELRLRDTFNQSLYSKEQHKTTGQHVILATEVYPVGGHGRVLNQIASNFPCHTVFTDVFGSIKNGKISIDRSVSRELLSTTILAPEGLKDKVVQGLNLLNAISPDSLILLGHHEDVVAILLGALYRRGSRTIYIHHTDHSPALGATIDFPVHLDTTSELQELCCNFGLKSSVIPLCVDEIGKRVAPPADNQLVIASSGTGNKFEGEIGGIRYADLVAECVGSGYVSKFIHIGDLYPSTREELTKEFNARGLSTEIFLPLGRVGNISSALLQNGVNLYLSSFPVAGGLATSEAQSVGAPVVYPAHVNCSLPLCHVPSIFANPQLGWIQVTEVKHILKAALDDWESLSREALEHYSRKNSRHAFVMQMRSSFSDLNS